MLGEGFEQSAILCTGADGLTRIGHTHVLG
jgi:hypothetical protein